MMPGIGRPWWEKATADDVVTVGAQLGRPATGLLAVAARCRFGQPAVVVTAPAVEGPDGVLEPFPTTFWLTCPYLAEEVSRLESQGWIARLSGEFKRDPQKAAALRAAHEGTAELRRQMVTPPIMERLERISPHAVRRLASAGVAGSRHFEAVKCLHAHLADHLGRGGNPVGRRVVELLDEHGVTLSGSPACRTEQAGACPARLPEGRSVSYNEGRSPILQQVFEDAGVAKRQTRGT